jgi:SNF2 family DNA or RNA helicase
MNWGQPAWNIARLHEVRHRVAARTQSVRKTDPCVREFFRGNTIDIVPVQMSREDRRLYNWVLDKAWQARKNDEPLIGCYRLLRYICNTPLALQASIDPMAQELCEAHPNLITNSHCAKLEVFLSMVESIAEQEDKVIAFTHWTNLSLLLLAPEVQKRGIDHVLHYGVGQKSAESQAAQHIFKTDPKITLFFSSDAGAHGLNLPEAKYNISYEVPYSYDVLMQRSERNNRADSQFDTTTYIYITENTVEEHIYEINEERRKLAAATLGTNETLSYGGRATKSEEANLAYLLFGEDKK